MSSPAPTSDPSVLETTRKQLEELDSLIQRMLELPVSQLEDDPFSDLPAVPDAEEESVPADDPEPDAAGEAASPVGPAGKDEAGKREAAAPTAAPEPMALPPAAVAAPSLATSHRPARPPRWLAALMWSNRVYDRLVLQCGRPGLWLRSRRGRNVVGWSGVLLLIAGTVWGVLDWITWNW